MQSRPMEGRRKRDQLTGRFEKRERREKGWEDSTYFPSVNKHSHPPLQQPFQVMVGLVMHIHRRRPSDPTERSGDGRGGWDPGTFPFWVDSEGFEDPGRVEVGD